PKLHKSHQRMPLFGRKQTEAGKRRLERKLYLAQESESSPFDLSECELTEVPTGVYTQIRVLRKEALLLNDNWLTSLGPESKLTSLANLRVLDLRNNELTDLPNNIGCLTCLQVLSLDRNKLTWLPASMQSMRNLQTLGLRDNRLKSLPSEIFLGLASLKLLDIAGNPMRQLPRTICQARTLENLTLSPQGFTYPSKEICAQGTEAIMRFLCKEAGVQYEPPSRFALHILPSPEVESSGGGPGMGGGGNSGPLLKELANDYEDSVQVQERVLAQRRQQRQELERQIQEDSSAQLALATRSQEQRRAAVDRLDADAADGQALDLAAVQAARQRDRQRLVEDVSAAESSADRLIRHLLDWNVRASGREAILEQLEQQDQEESLTELTAQHRSEILASMDKLLAESDSLESRRRRVEADRADAVTAAAKAGERTEEVERALDTHASQRRGLVSSIAEEQSRQREAFAQLLIQRDYKSQRLCQEVSLIERELCAITRAEMQRRRDRSDASLTALAAKRDALIRLLQQLMDERTKRANELTKRLAELEEQRKADQIDYWLVQYQRLMERRPGQLEPGLSVRLTKLLAKAGAQSYEPQFLRHRVLNLKRLRLCADDADLRDTIGIRELGVRRAIIAELAALGDDLDDSEAENDNKESGHPPDKFDEEAAACREKLEPSAPPMALVAPASEPQPASVVRARTAESTGCCVCMDATPDTLFLNCGHVCCCEACSTGLSLCPLCRQPILRRIFVSALMAEAE
ncbi:hypothetical protein BOX15_Mlig001233g4, partial [Macrostomum lignano]